MSVSPAWKSGMSLPAASFAICSFSISLSKFMANSPSAAQASRRSDQSTGGLNGLGALLRQSADFFTSLLLSFRFLGNPLKKRAPQVRPPFAGEPFGLGAPPGGDLGMIARNQDLRDRPGLPQLWAGILRVFE